MSYSVCINCEQMVPAYEKYCGQCLKLYPQLKQDKDFWRHNVYNVYTWETAKRLKHSPRKKLLDSQKVRRSDKAKG